MKDYSNENLFTKKSTIAKPLLKTAEYPWEVLSGIKKFILELGKKLPADKFDEIKPNVWVAKSATVHESAVFVGPCIIDEGATIRPSAFIRENVIVGKKAMVGNSTELKNSILFDKAQAPHFNYVGDSILGYKAHLGAGAVTSNLKSDRTPISIRGGEDGQFITGLIKMGAMIGDKVEVGCNAVLNPGTVIGQNSNIYPSASVRGIIPRDSIYKSEDNIVKKNYKTI